MKTGLFKSARCSRANPDDGFTLVELLVVIGVIAVLVVIQLPALAAGKTQSKIAICASHVRQLALCCQIYANENNNLLPVLPSGGFWPWDLPTSTANAFLNYGAQTNTFYCPGTAPRFTDAQNWALWNYAPSIYHITGYSFALSGEGSTLAPTNQNTTIQPEAIHNFPSPGKTTTYRASERVLVADAILSTGRALPGYAHPENNYTDIGGGLSVHYVSPHLNGVVPMGGNLGFKDGHVAWRRFQMIVPRTVFTGPYFWW